ncbi:hypothetical protein MNBD_GAMMA26-2281 [hydrothermal vent metagenome]|uniref:NnrS protein involved in response to NO n=1 Tax=hydrothermal vent metagenome TaxID=652676 RepID=A0A3B1ASV9_9ZZZZ
MLFMVLLIIHYHGLVSSEVALSIHHAYAMIFLVFTQFFMAFLLTMFPRFLSVPLVPQALYMRVFLLLNASSIVVAVSLYVSQVLVVAGMLGVLTAFLMACRILLEMNRQSSVVNRYDTNWIFVALGMGVLSQLLFICLLLGVGGYDLGNFAVNTGFFLYLFMIVLILSQKVIPFFTEGKIKGYQSNKSRYFLEPIFGLLMCKVVLQPVGLATYGFVVDVLLFAIILREIVKWQLPFFKVEAILWVLYLALLWAPLGFLIFFLDGLNQYLSGGVTINFEKSHIHALALGYFTTIAVGFGSRIILGHSGRKPVADRYTIGLFGLVQVLVVVRIFGGLSVNLDASWYVGLMLISATLWLVLFMLWSARYVKMLFERYPYE